MTYTPTDWVDNVTLVDASKMDKIEQGIVDAHTAIAGFSGVDYIGDWGAGTAYKRGDVVRHNGVDYLAVNPSTGQTPPTVFGPVGAAYGTSLPASPIDGQEYTLVDSVTNPLWQWRFRYNAGSSSAYKWEFIGGAAAHSEVPTGQNTASTTYTDLATVGPQITVSRAGDYRFSFGAQVSSEGTFLAFMTVKLGAAAASDLECLVQGTSVGIVTMFSQPSATYVRTVAAGAVLKVQYHGSGGSTATFGRRWLDVVPVRVA